MRDYTESLRGIADRLRATASEMVGSNRMAIMDEVDNLRQIIREAPKPMTPVEVASPAPAPILNRAEVARDSIKRRRWRKRI